MYTLVQLHVQQTQRACQTTQLHVYAHIHVNSTTIAKLTSFVVHTVKINGLF